MVTLYSCPDEKRQSIVSFFRQACYSGTIFGMFTDFSLLLAAYNSYSIKI